MKRIEILDGMRGFFLTFMLINHLVLTGGLWLQDFTLAQAMFVEDAQGFVFLSGFLIGLIQYGRMERRGYLAMRHSIWHRALELYAYAMGVIALVFIARGVLPDGVEAFRNWTGTAETGDPVRILAMLGLVFQPTFMDILPQYILYLLVAPPLILWISEGRWAWVVTLSVLVWMAAQTGVDQLIGAPLQYLAQTSDGQGLRGSFNPLGWQIVFMSGMVLGTLTQQGAIDWGRFLSPDRTTLPKVALSVLAFFLPIRIATAHGWVTWEQMTDFNTMSIRPSFGPVYLISFAAAAALLAWLVVAGPRAQSRWVQAVAAGVRALLALPYLRLIGRHSLQTYAWHVVLVYGVYYLDARYGPFGFATKTAMAATCLMLLALPALWREHGRRVLGAGLRGV